MDLKPTFINMSEVDGDGAPRQNFESSCREQSEQTEDLCPQRTDKYSNHAHQFGRDVALAMAFMDAAERKRNARSEKSEKSNAPHPPPESSQQSKLSDTELASKLCKLGADIDIRRAELISLLVLFDEHKAWEASGARNCADWANANLGIAKSSVYEMLRVGRELLTLPIIAGLFRGGELTWSKTRLLTRVADASNERDLSHVAISATVSDVERICREFRWDKSDAETLDPETGRSIADLRAEQQLNNRSFTWQEQSDGSVQIRINLPADKAQIVLKSVEHCASELYESAGLNDSNESDKSNSVEDKPTVNQRRADALV